MPSALQAAEGVAFLRLQAAVGRSRHASYETGVRKASLLPLQEHVFDVSLRKQALTRSASSSSCDLRIFYFLQP